MLVLDVVDDLIMFVEVIERPRFDRPALDLA
jgi:hypothetical protein